MPQSIRNDKKGFFLFFMFGLTEMYDDIRSNTDENSIIVIYMKVKLS